jgi:hypothetical protein
MDLDEDGITHNSARLSNTHNFYPYWLFSPIDEYGHQRQSVREAIKHKSDLVT